MNSPCNLVVDPRFSQASIRDGFLQLRSPVDASVGHCNIKPGQRGRNSRILRVPIRNNKSLEAKLSLQQPVQSIAIGTAIRIVYSIRSQRSRNQRSSFVPIQKTVGHKAAIACLQNLWPLRSLLYHGLRKRHVYS